MNRYTYVRNNPLRYLDEDGNYWVEAVLVAGKTEFQVTRETTSRVGTWIETYSWNKIIDFRDRQQRADTNRPSIIPGRGFVFPGDQFNQLEEPTRYSLYEGIQLDEHVFAAYSKEFGKPQQENINGTTSFMTLSRNELQQFGDFHTAYRYAQEIQGLERKLAKTKDEKKREKIQRDIEKRKKSKAYEKYGRNVQKYLTREN